MHFHNGMVWTRTRIQTYHSLVLALDDLAILEFVYIAGCIFDGGDRRTRTFNRLRMKKLHYQLCYIAIGRFRGTRTPNSLGVNEVR